MSTSTAPDAERPNLRISLRTLDSAYYLDFARIFVGTMPGTLPSVNGSSRLGCPIISKHTEGAVKA